MGRQLRLAVQAVEFVEAEPKQSRQKISDALGELASNPSLGRQLPFPWVPGIWGYTKSNYVIHYQFSDGLLDIVNIQKLPDIDEILASVRRLSEDQT